jgi:glutaconate CoA-transferase subunit B
VVTDLALLDFEPVSRRIRLRRLQAGATVGQVREQTGFDLLVGDDIEELVPPSAEELAIRGERPERVEGAGERPDPLPEATTRRSAK